MAFIPFVVPCQGAAPGAAPLLFCVLQYFNELNGALWPPCGSALPAFPFPSFLPTGCKDKQTSLPGKCFPGKISKKTMGFLCRPVPGTKAIPPLFLTVPPYGNAKVQLFPLIPKTYPKIIAQPRQKTDNQGLNIPSYPYPCH